MQGIKHVGSEVVDAADDRDGDQIMSMSTSKTGKHGHAKMNIVGVDVLTSKKYEDMTPTSHTVMVPIVTKTEFQVIDIADGYVHVKLDMNEGYASMD